MDPCDPKTNVSVARAAVIDNLLVPSKIVANLTQTELCDLLKTCGTKQLPEPPLMTRPKRVGKYMISIYIRSPLNVKETEILLRSKPNPSKLKSIAEKLGVFVNGENLKQRILSKLSADGIPEPIKYSATDRVQKNVPVLNNTAQSFKLANTPKNSNFNNTGKNLNGGGNRVNGGENRINGGENRINGDENRVNGGVSRVNGGVSRVNGGVSRVNGGGNRKFNMSRSRLTLTPNNFKPNQQPQYALPSGKNKRIVAGPWNYARGPSYQIASREQQQLMKQYQTSRNAARYGVPYGGSSNRFMRERMALNQERQKLALNMRKAQQNKELNAKRREFNERVKKLSNMEKQLANKLKAAPQPAPTPRPPAPVPPSDMNKIKRNLANAQKIIIELKQKPQNAAIVAKLNNAKARVLVMNNQVAITQAVTVPKVVEVAKQAKALPEDQKQQAVQQVIAELKPVATTNAQTQYVAKLEKLVAEKKTSEALNSIEKESNVQFDSEKVRKMKNLIGKAASGVAGAVSGGASYLYRKVTRTLTIEEKRALLNKLLKNSSVSNANKVKIKAVQNLTNFPKMKSVENVAAYYNKLMKNKNYAEIAAIAEQYGGIRGSLANLRKVGVNKKDERLVELINRFQGANGGAARVSRAANVNRNARLQEIIIELEKSNKPTINRSELEKLLKQFKIDPTNVLANVPGNEVKKEAAVAAVQTVAATASLNSGPGSEAPPVSPNLENFARRWYAYMQRSNKRVRNENLERIARNIGENFKKVEKLIEEMKNQAPPPNAPTNIPKKSINLLVRAGRNITNMLVNDESGRKKAFLKHAQQTHQNKGGNLELSQAIGQVKETSKDNPTLIQPMREYFQQEWAKRSKLEALRSNYNSMKARKGRPGNKVNENGKPINQLIKNYEQALINLNRQPTSTPVPGRPNVNFGPGRGPNPQSQNDEYQKLYKNLMEAYEKSPNVNINRFTQIYANQGKSLNERKKALRNARAFFDKLEVLRSNYNSMKARKGRPGNKVNEKGKPINQLIKNYEQALVNLNKQANAKPHASSQAGDLMNVLKGLGPVKYRQNPQYRALPASEQKNMNEALELLFVLPKGTEKTYQSKLQVASLINKKAAASVQSQLLAKINMQGEPTPAMYGVAEIELNNIILKFKQEGENLLKQGSCPTTYGDPATIAALLENTGNAELNKLRKRLANVCSAKKPGMATRGIVIRELLAKANNNANKNKLEQLLRANTLSKFPSNKKTQESVKNFIAFYENYPFETKPVAQVRPPSVKINPSVLAGATNSERQKLNNLRRNIRAISELKKRKAPNGLNTMTNKELRNILKNLQANNSGLAPMAGFGRPPRRLPPLTQPPVVKSQGGQPLPGFGGVNFGNNVNINKKAAHEKLIKELEGELSELPENEVNRAVIRGLFPKENSTNATAARRVMVKARKLLELVKPYQTKLEPKHFQSEKTIDELLTNVQASNLRIKEIQGLRFREGEVGDIGAAIEMLNMLPTKRKIPIWIKYRKELTDQLKKLEFNKKFKRGKGGNNWEVNRNRPKTTVEPRGSKEQGNQPTLPSSLNFRNLQEKAKASRLTKEKAEANRLAKEKAEANRLAKEKEEANRLAKEKEEANRLTKEKEEANRLTKEKEEANRLAKEKAEAARKKKLKKQLSNAWSKNLETFGTLKNPLFNDLQSYINGGSGLSENVGKYAANNNPAQHPMLLKKLNSFIESSSNNGLNLKPVKELQRQLKELVKAEANRQLKITEAAMKAQRNENERRKAEEELAKAAERAKENEAQKAKKKKEVNDALAQKKKNFTNWFSGLTSENRKALKNMGNINNLNLAKKYLARIIKDRKLSAIRKIKSSNVRSSENIISYLENENKNVQKAAVNRVLNTESAKVARYMFTNKNDPRLLRLEYLSGQLKQGLNAQRIAQLLRIKEAPSTFKVAKGAKNKEVVQSKKKKVNPNSPSQSPNTNSNIENEGSTNNVKKRVAAEKKNKPKLKASNQSTKGAKTGFLQRLEATASFQPQPPNKAVSRTNRGKAAQRKKVARNNIEPGPSV